MTKRILLLLVLGILAVACSKKVTASQDFKAAMEEFKPVMKSFSADFQKHERALQTLRDKDPAAAKKTIEAEMLPLFDRVDAALAKALDAGTNYVKYADDEDPVAVEGIRKNLDGMARQREGFAKARALYGTQAKKLASGPLTDADLTTHADGLVRAMKLVAAGR